MVALALIGLGAIWLSDKVTLQGERTIYTVQCGQGQWDGLRCTGRLVAGPRFRYRALKRRREVIFWVLGEATPSRKLTDCAIDDGRNWTCKPNDDAAYSITLAMHRGRAVHDESGVAPRFRATTKRRWWLLKLGIAQVRSASY